MNIEKIEDIKNEIPAFANYEQEFFHMKDSYKHLWEKYLAEERSLALYYLVDDKEIIGLLGTTIEEVSEDKGKWKQGERYSFLMAIVVEDNYKGKGLGKKLMEFYIDQSKQDKVDFLYLRVDPKNIKAIGLYKKYGFKETSRNENSVYMEKRFRKY